MDSLDFGLLPLGGSPENARRPRGAILWFRITNTLAALTVSSVLFNPTRILRSQASEEDPGKPLSAAYILRQEA